MRMFKTQAHLGNGDASLLEAYHLERRLREGIDLLDRLQQPPLRSHGPAQALQYPRDLADLRDVAEDIVCALLGPEYAVSLKTGAKWR